MTLENIPYDILIHVISALPTVKLYTSPEKGSHTAQDWVIQMTINRFMRWFQYELQQSMNLGDPESAVLRRQPVKQYLIDSLHVTLLSDFGIREHSSS
jgi:hypothetical protein